MVDYPRVQLDFSAREVTIKLVYYGPALSGKTTNLVSLHALAGAEARGRLMTLETQDDRTLFFDLLPLTFRAKDGEEQLAWRDHLLGMGLEVSPVMDREYFQSIHFSSPDGQLLEIATDGPGFSVDEPVTKAEG